MSVPLNAMYRSEVDRVAKHEWHAILQQFRDAHIYQTWSFAATKWEERNLSHLVLRKDSEIVAAAQLVIARMPLLGTGIAHIQFGPMWRLRGKQSDVEIYVQMLRALRQEYAERRGLVLRIKSWEVSEDRATLQPLRETEGFRWRRKLPHYITYVIDLSLSEGALFQRLKPNWRRHLKQAQRHDLDIRFMGGPQAVKIFLGLYHEMHTRKRFHDTTEAARLNRFYADLPKALRPQIIISTFRGEHVAADVISVAGDVGFCLFGVATPLGRELRISYLTLWWTLSWFKRQGCRWCDLVGGYDDPGLRQFKAGLAGGEHARLEYMGCFDARGRVSSQITVGLGSRLRKAQFVIGKRLSELRNIWTHKHHVSIRS